MNHWIDVEHFNKLSESHEFKGVKINLFCTNDEYNIEIVEFLFSMNDLAEIDNTMDIKIMIGGWKIWLCFMLFKTFIIKRKIRI